MCNRFNSKKATWLLKNKNISLHMSFLISIKPNRFLFIFEMSLYIFFSFFILFCMNGISGEVIERQFLVKSKVTNDITYMIKYIEKINSLTLVENVITISNETISKIFKNEQKKKISTVFAYLPDQDFDMINKIAVQYNIYVWNAVAYASATCYSNIIFGYDISISTLLSM